MSHNPAREPNRCRESKTLDGSAFRRSDNGLDDVEESCDCPCAAVIPIVIQYGTCSALPSGPGSAMQTTSPSVMVPVARRAR